MEEFRRAGTEVLFLNRPIGGTAEDDLLLQMQGVIAEYERAKILERSRRGRRHAARSGLLSAFTKAPFGYRYVPRGTRRWRRALRGSAGGDPGRASRLCLDRLGAAQPA